MRMTRTVTTLAAAGLVAATVTAATVTGAASGAGAAEQAAGTASAATRTAGACTPSWKLVATPAPPGSPTEISGAAVLSAKDAWFPGWTSFQQPDAGDGSQPWVLHWNGHSLKQAAAIPHGPFTERDASDGSFDSATDGWVLGTSNILPVAYPQYAARWHDGQWTITPLAVSPDPATYGVGLTAVDSLTPDSAWAVGGFYQGLASAGALIEHWDGTQWSIVPNPASSKPGAVLNAITVVSADDIWAVGQQQNSAGAIVPLAEQWDGTAWSVVPVPVGHSPSHLLAVSGTGADDVWAVGARTEHDTSDTGVNLVEHWNGAAWSVVTGLPSLGNSELEQVYAASPTDVWATVATIRTDTDFGVNDFLHWDGTTWTAVPAPGPAEYGLDYEYTGLDGTGPDNIWAAGYSSDVNADDTSTPLIAHLSCG